MNKKEFVKKFAGCINPMLPSDKYELIEGKNLFYELTLNRKLEVENIENQTRGKSAFQTDLILYEKNDKDGFPLVVFEFKMKPSTHDIMVYSAKARKQKQIYPWLRYGMLICGTNDIPIRKFLKHNEFLDFCVSVKNIINEEVIPNNIEIDKIIKFINSEINDAKNLERIHFETTKVNFYQKRIELSTSKN
jgi:hypothetical protein